MLSFHTHANRHYTTHVTSYMMTRAHDSRAADPVPQLPFPVSMVKTCENCKRFSWKGRWSSQGRRHGIFGVGLSRQALDFLAVLSYESKPGVFALRLQPLSRCDITFLVLLLCFYESDYRSRGFPNETFVSVNRYFTQPLKCRILKPVFV